ncbi:WD repeat domain-containing protein 83 [Tanacetum coccineum]
MLISNMLLLSYFASLVYADLDDLMLASCGDDGQVMYWDLSTQCLVRSIGRHAGLVNAVNINHFGSVIVSADNCVRLWDLRSPTMDPIKIFDTFEDIVTSLCVKRAEIIAGSYDGSVQQFDIRNNKDYEWYSDRGEFWIQVHDLPLGMLSSEYATELAKSLGKLIELDCVGEGPQTGRDFLPPICCLNK